MCKAPKPPKPKEPEKPEFLRNRYLDAAIGQSGIVSALRAGRSSLRIPLASPTAIADVPLGATATPPSPVTPVPVAPTVAPIATRGPKGPKGQNLR
jgi:hypothetical protein